MGTQKIVELPRRMVSSVSPLTGELLREFEQDSDEAVESKLSLAAAAFREHRKVPFAKRAAMMLRAADILEKEKDIFGRMMTQEMGKTLKSAVQEAEKSASGCRYYAENAEKFLADEEAKDKCCAQLCPIPADWAGAGRYAMELPFLAGLSLCRSRADGRQRRAAQACLQRAAVRVGY